MRPRLAAACGLLVVLASCGGNESSEPQRPGRLVLLTQPSFQARSGIALERPPVVQVQTESGETLRGAGRVINVSIASGGGTLQGASSATTDAEGRATFTDLAIIGPVGDRVLSFESAGVASATSGAITLSAGSAAQLVPISGLDQQAPAEQRLAVPVVVEARDAAGNPVARAEVRSAVLSGGGTLVRSVDTTSGNGRVTFTGWTLGPNVGVQEVRLTSGIGVMHLTARATGLQALEVDLSNHGCAIIVGGSLRCWGNNYAGQLGEGTREDRLRPVPSAAGFSFSAIALGGNHSCGLSGADVYCWGSGGRLGDGSVMVDKYTPVRVLLPAGATQVSSNNGGVSCAILADRSSWCWADNFRGELGDGTTTNRPSPVRIGPNLSFASINASIFSSCGIDTQGSAHCWGAGYTGGLGTGDTVSRYVPTPVIGGLKFTQVGAGGQFGCGLTPEGVVYCWGWGNQGTVGDGTFIDRYTPTPIASNARFVALSVAPNHSCAITTDGQALCWGQNTYGQLGNGQTSPRVNVPMLVLGGHRWKRIAAGWSGTCAIEVSGQVYCWGLNTLGQNGDGTTAMRTIPVGVLP